MIYRLSAKARRDLENMYDWVASNFGERRAAQALSDTLAVFDILAEAQGMGHERPDVLGSFRFYYFEKNWIVYLPGETLRIHRVYPAVRDLRYLRP